MASAGLREELECSICLSIYTDPVTLRCGHNFCQGCIHRVLATQEGSGGYSCPECREEFKERSALQRNIKLRNIVENFLSTQPGQDESQVFCSQCFHAPVPAVKSCLLCEVSLCENHLRVHKKSPEHVLCDPTSSPETRKCSIHQEVLKYYCTEDSSCICVSCCLIGKHKGHQMESLDEASKKKKKKLRDFLQEVMSLREENEKRVQSLEERRRKAQEKAADETETVTALFRDLRRRLEELEKRVLGDLTRQAERVSSHYNDVIRQLGIRKEELSRKMRHIEELCNMTDPLTVLQESNTRDTYDTEEGDRHDGGDLDVTGISHTLHTGLADIMSGVTGGLYIQPADISLDVNTASNYLQISDDRKSAIYAENQIYPDTPERFQDYIHVLSSRSFSSGRHYWEVDVGGSERWRVGMCYPSIDRRGDQALIRYNYKSWTLDREYDQYSVIHGSEVIQLPDGICSDRVRVSMDYEAGQISFYALCDPIRHFHTFTATFTEPLYAGLAVATGCVKISGGNQK
ncbi:E3 ubiquitin-protein ligase TRIM39-like [Hyperolius riggenbachi]|uniref:E3 ubiquitin-protein ligase TRIM39-like n=1 Tax=Hyperolius riggenbachi TaxID=752182 RepID=UPI0035A2D0FC